MQDAKLLLDGGEGRLHLGLARHVADEQGAAAIPAAQLGLGDLQIGAIDVDEGQHSPLSGQAEGDGAAQPASRPRDGDDLLLDIHGDSLPADWP
ncbi:hypothetical protein D3C80_1352000 [compost metagenome]